jgi:hypothetical protein
MANGKLAVFCGLIPGLKINVVNLRRAPTTAANGRKAVL